MNDNLGPVLIEAKTYRYRGHSMSDPGKYRTREEIQETRENRDPIERVRTLLINKSILNEDELKEIDKVIKSEVLEASEEHLGDICGDLACRSGQERTKHRRAIFDG